MSENNDINYSKEACYKRLPILLAPFNFLYGLEFRDDRIILPCEYKANIVIFSIILALILPFFLTNIVDFNLKLSRLNHMAFMVALPLIVVILRIYLIKTYRVIYFKDKYIVTDVFVFGIHCAQINKINFNSIIKVANDMSWTGYIIDQNRYDDRRDFIYKVSLLLNDGKIFNLYTLGNSKDDYSRSIDIARAISKGLAVPLAICQDGYRLKSVLTYSGYTFSLKKIIKKEKSSIYKTFLILLISLSFVIYHFGFIYFYQMAKTKTGIEFWKIKRDIKTIFNIK